MTKGTRKQCRAVVLSLHERSLLARLEVLGRSRYSMLATVQEYAADKLPAMAAAQLKRVHARHFLEVVRAADQQLGTTGYPTALERITIDFANFEAAIKESRDSGDHNSVLEFSALLADYFRIRGRHNDRLGLAMAARAAAENLDTFRIAGADNNLGVAYAGLPTGDRGDYLRRAIACGEAALRVSTERDFPQQWAGTQNNLGAVHAELPTGNRGFNVAIAAQRIRGTEIGGRFPGGYPTDGESLGRCHVGAPLAPKLAPDSLV